ncbi:nucleoside hydrolase [Clostridium sp.]|uniref:nucleoside hydrolase n=1 Tax=Clostridium sp. TaxID=1506 RepID=UPI002FCC8807
MTKKMILDVDTGIDDAMALAYALGDKNIDLIGVTGTYGNVYTDQGVQNVLNLLHMLNRDDIPVFAGLDHAIAKDKFDRLEISARIHGDNGVGQVNVETSPNKMETTSAIDFIIESAYKYENELVVVATGPMTNIASAIKKDPTITKKINQIVLMGGALTVPGNVNQFAEANIFQDPEACKYLFESDANVVMVGLDVTNPTVLKYEDTAKWRELGTTSGIIFADMVDYYIDIYLELLPHLNGCALHDPSAVVAAMNPELFTMLPIYMTVETEGPSRGRTIGDPNRVHEKNPNVKVCIGADKEAVVSTICSTLGGLFAQN